MGYGAMLPSANVLEEPAASVFTTKVVKSTRPQYKKKTTATLQL
jgi:hypothetical protein